MPRKFSRPLLENSNSLRAFAYFAYFSPSTISASFDYRPPDSPRKVEKDIAYTLWLLGAEAEVYPERNPAFRSVKAFEGPLSHLRDLLSRRGYATTPIAEGRYGDSLFVLHQGSIVEIYEEGEICIPIAQKSFNLRKETRFGDHFRIPSASYDVRLLISRGSRLYGISSEPEEANE